MRHTSIVPFFYLANLVIEIAAIPEVQGSHASAGASSVFGTPSKVSAFILPTQSQSRSSTSTPRPIEVPSTIVPPESSHSSRLPEPGPGQVNGVADGDAQATGAMDFVVLFDPDHPEPPEVGEVLTRIGLNTSHPDVGYVFDNSQFRGFSGCFEDKAVSALNNMSDVRFVEQSIQTTSLETQTRTGVPWGLQRISQQGLVSGDASKMQFRYEYDDSRGLGSGVDIYVVDTGINTDHLAFGGRAKMGFSMDGDADLSASCDQDGHGTHVSGTAAAAVFGVASGANLIGVKVLGANGAGMSSDTIKGLDYVIQQHDQRKGQSGFIGSIASMSWGLPSRSPSVEQAVSAAVGAGIHVSVAGGNQAQDACDSAPSSMGGAGGPAIAVGSIGIGDTISSFSNTGPCIDVYAPGESVISTWINGPSTVQTLSGTSMATPHVTGLMAYLMANSTSLASSPQAMKAFLASSATAGVLQASDAMTPGDLSILINNGVSGSSYTVTETSSQTSRFRRRGGCIESP